MEAFIKRHPLLKRVCQRESLNGFPAYLNPIDQNKTVNPSVRRPVTFVQSVAGSAVRFLSCVCTLPLRIDTPSDSEDEEYKANPALAFAEVDVTIAFEVVGQNASTLRVSDAITDTKLTDIQCTALCWSGALGLECSYYFAPLADFVIVAVWGRYGMSVFGATTDMNLFGQRQVEYESDKLRVVNLFEHDEEGDDIAYLDVALNPHNLGEIAVLAAPKGLIQIFDVLGKSKKPIARILLQHIPTVPDQLELEDVGLKRIEGLVQSARVEGETFLNEESFTCLTYTYAPSVLVVGGARLWLFELKKRIMTCLYPLPGAVRISVDLRNAHDEVPMVNDLSFSAVTVHSERLHLLAAVSSVGMCVYFFDLRIHCNLTPVGRLPLYPEFRAGVFHHKLLWLSKEVIKNTHGPNIHPTMTSLLDCEYLVIAPASTFQECLRAPSQTYRFTPPFFYQSGGSWKPQKLNNVQSASSGSSDGSSDRSRSDDEGSRLKTLSASLEAPKLRLPFDYCLLEFSPWTVDCHTVDFCLRGIGDLGLLSRQSVALIKSANLIFFETGPELGTINRQILRDLRVGEQLSPDEIAPDDIDSQFWLDKISEWIKARQTLTGSQSTLTGYQSTLTGYQSTLPGCKPTLTGCEPTFTGYLDAEHFNEPHIHSWSTQETTHALAMPTPACFCGSAETFKYNFAEFDPLQPDIIGPAGHSVIFSINKHYKEITNEKEDKDKDGVRVFSQMLKRPKVDLSMAEEDVPTTQDRTTQDRTTQDRTTHDDIPTVDEVCQKRKDLCAIWSEDIQQNLELPTEEGRTWTTPFKPFGLTVNRTLVEFLDKSWKIEGHGEGVSLKPRWVNVEAAKQEEKRRRLDTEATLKSIMASQNLLGLGAADLTGELAQLREGGGDDFAENPYANDDD